MSQRRYPEGHTLPEPEPLDFDIRICNNSLCSKPFRPNRKWQIYCSHYCRTHAFYVRQAQRMANIPSPPNATPLDKPPPQPEPPEQTALEDLGYGDLDLDFGKKAD